MKTLIIGNFGAGNIGDELILNAALEDYSNVVVMTSDAEASQTFCEKRFECVRFFPTGIRSGLSYLFKKDYRDSVRRLKEVDQIVFPGGGLFAIKFRAVFLWFVVYLWCRWYLKGKPVHFLHQGVDKELGFFSKMYTRIAFQGAEKVSTRDQSSAEALNYLVVDKIKESEDQVEAFLPKQKWAEEGSGKGKKILLINALSPLPENIFESLQNSFPNYHIKYFAFQEGDRVFAPKELKREIVKPVVKTEVFKYFQNAQIVIGERYHFLLLGQFFCGKEKTMLIKRPYAEKAKSLQEKYGLKIWTK